MTRKSKSKGNSTRLQTPRSSRRSSSVSDASRSPELNQTTRSLRRGRPQPNYRESFSEEDQFSPKKQKSSVTRRLCTPRTSVSENESTVTATPTRKTRSVSKRDTIKDNNEFLSSNSPQCSNKENYIFSAKKQYSKVIRRICSPRNSVSENESAVTATPVRRTRSASKRDSLEDSDEFLPLHLPQSSNKENFENRPTEVDIYKTPTKSTKSKTAKTVTPRRTPILKSKKKSGTVTKPQSPMKSPMATPKLKIKLKCSSLTPSIQKKLENLVIATTPLQEARSRLHVSAVPKSLPCREVEFNDIYSFLESKLSDKMGGCFYISGVPGTGKTATVREAIKCLQRAVIKGKLDEFKFIEINGMRLTEPRQAYVQILKQLTHETRTWEQAYDILQRRFSKNPHNAMMTLLLVDELDLLYTKRQDVIYNLLDWPTKASAKLVVITIANTMDLPERVLMGRVASRLGLSRLTFQPYTHQQLQKIVLTRLKDIEAFQGKAVEFIARKISAVSGDARRALDICRRAAEIAEYRGEEVVKLQDVGEALAEMIASPKVQAIQNCSTMEQLFLQAVSGEISRTGFNEVRFSKVYEQLVFLCSFDGIDQPNMSQVFAICSRLSSSRLLICEHPRHDIHMKILLNVSQDDIHYALQSLDIL